MKTNLRVGALYLLTFKFKKNNCSVVSKTIGKFFKGRGQEGEQRSN